MEPISHFFYSHRLKLQFWDWGGEGAALLLVHGGLDHARNWDWVARSLRQHFHVYAVDLRGHGNSQTAEGSAYTAPEHVLDISALLDVIGSYPVYLVGHSLGGILSLMYAGVYPDRVKKVVSIEGVAFPPTHKVYAPAPERMRRWIERVRQAEQREPRAYETLDAAVARMKEANPHLSDDVARHLTLHGTNWQSNGSLVWKFDNYARIFPPMGLDLDDFKELLANITCPVQLFWGLESWAPDPEPDGRLSTLKDYRMVRVPNAGHWVHHDQLGIFLREATAFLTETTPLADARGSVSC